MFVVCYCPMFASVQTYSYCETLAVSPAYLLLLLVVHVSLHRCVIISSQHRSYDLRVLFIPLHIIIMNV